MAKLLSDQTADELPEIFEAVRNMVQETRGRPIRRDRGIGGGDAARPWVIITEVTSPSVYIGNILEGPTDSTIVEEAVSIAVFGATANPFQVGYEYFADVSDEIYYLDGSVLG